MTLEQRFWKKVSRNSDSECWIWTAAHSKKGYGVIGRGGRGAGNVFAHRLSWELHNGSIPEGMWVLHKCDNPRCVNPAHLFLGDNADNVRDMVSKGRQQRKCGEDASRAKLTAADVAQIKSLKAGGATSASVGRLFGVSAWHVSMIATGKTWRHL